VLPERYTPVYAPPFERVMRCATCGAYWLHGEDHRMGFGDGEDRIFDRYARLTDAEAEARLG
jgi:hypothetical protein